MEIKLTFLGAAQNVTGSRYLLEVNGSRILIDCGLYQEREFKSRNWEPFPVPSNTIDAILLTHAHLDHSGYLPKLVREGFEGKVYCTQATSEIAQIILLDSAHIQEEDAKFKEKRHKKEGRKGPHPEIPLYTTDDAKASFAFLSPVEYIEPVEIADGIVANFYDAGHILGSSMIKLTINQNDDVRTIIFSGDIGRWETPILEDPTIFHEADYILTESTYGDRLHGERTDIADILADAIHSTLRRGGNILIPSFAVERSQEILYYLNQLQVADRIPSFITFLDSPMAIRVTKVFENHTELFDDDMLKLLQQHLSPFKLNGLKLTQTVEESKAINQIKGSALIIAGSGMCNAGRIKHHLFHNISRRESTVLFVGYQAQGTLGRIILDGAEEVRILGQMHRVHARIMQIHGFSAHADKNELFRWLSGIQKSPKQVFVTHGETESAKHYSDYIVEKTGWKVSTPTYKSEYILD